MKQIKSLFWDIGGVVLTDAWDHTERARAIEEFRLQKDDFETRHKQFVVEFEEGKLTLDQYIDRTVFYQKRGFTPEDFKNFMFSLSKPKPEMLAFARTLSNKYLMVTLNNESRELNEYRIRKFSLSQIFDLFLSSCYVRLRKPDEHIYRLALDSLQKSPDECCFIDDRPENIEAAVKLGIHTVLLRDINQLRENLQNLGVAT